MTPSPPLDEPGLPPTWQLPVSRAVDALLTRLAVPRSAVAVGWVAEIGWLVSGEVPSVAPDRLPRNGRGLDVRLVSGGRTYRYLVPLPDGEPIRDPGEE